MSDILARIDATLAENEYVRWDGHSDDAATWNADGTHEEPDETVCTDTGVCVCGRSGGRR